MRYSLPQASTRFDEDEPSGSGGAGGGGHGFLMRDVVRFFLVDFIVTASLRLLELIGFFKTVDQNVIASNRHIVGSHLFHGFKT